MRPLLLAPPSSGLLTCKGRIQVSHKLLSSNYTPRESHLSQHFLFLLKELAQAEMSKGTLDRAEKGGASQLKRNQQPNLFSIGRSIWRWKIVRI